MSNFIKKPWGHEIIWAKTEKYVGKILFIEKGQKLSLQYHQKKEETITVSKGLLHFTYGSDTDNLMSHDMKPGDVFHIPTGLVHRMEALEDTEVYEVSTPELDDVVRLQDDYGRT